MHATLARKPDESKAPAALAPQEAPELSTATGARAGTPLFLLRLGGGPPPVQRQEAEGIAYATLEQGLRSAGEPLDAAARDYFEPRFGVDFSGVRIHADAHAATSARALSARVHPRQ